ncbi:putative ATP-dependent RNA helicase DDX family protein [Neospora caninum Liverpool]|uniref:DEAD box protein 1 n=1 Tax=Neospora caninum (strain Liverpool) TaxID=572307 RepID=F0V7S2_NEOCL|nr:putative ATP-dependent RNA helicase DDX family protein [Neospora caninum Liverpool]CBZ49763.1 putative ATP-dependent RNA helicase DDX family protein [Neospora caninum Liverpool]CEL64350.1 TPA: ATP-dependent RNA helicase DDX family protein,putative [Neospora caninum Liverpool]|eukprot:XP_003879798.1 putative ATP-dependent RNA helicase DDX family protein [Neospora caninum Liverpool]
MSAFEEFGVCPEIIKAVEEDDWLLPTPIQAESIPLILGGGDVCAAAETGSGKTGAFGLPALQVVHETLRAAAQAAATASNHRNQGSRGCILDDGARDLLVCLGDGDRCSCSDPRGWRGVRGTAPVLSGKYMYEVEILSPGLMRVGWGTRLGKFEIGKDENSFGYGGTGKKSWNGRFEDYGVQFGAGDVVGCLLDRSNPERGTVSFAVNGRLLGEAFVLPPALRNSALLPAICGKDFDARCHFARLEFPVEGFAPLAALQACDDARSLADTSACKGATGVLCLILEPTRDLALQTFNCLKKFGKYLEAPAIRVALCCGGDEKEQREEIAKGPHIVVGTLQKVSSYIHRGLLSVKTLKFLILDEADELVKFDALSEILKIKRAATAAGSVSRRVQVSFFSATLHTAEVRQAVEALTERPTWVDLKGKATIPDTVHALICPVLPGEAPFKSASLGRVEPKTDGVHSASATLPPDSQQFASQRVKEIKPHLVVALADAFKMEACLVFCRTNLDCDNLEQFLTACGGGRRFSGKAESGKENPYSCVVLAGMRSQEERNRNLAHFKAGDVRFLICTDVAARGIDIHELPFLIMTTLPDDPDLFFHRVGRLGRADRLGLAICLASASPEQVWFHRCANRGQGCRNTRLLKEGGCTIWYDEPACLKAIEDRIGAPLPRMDPGNFCAPGIVDAFGVLADSGDNIRKRRNVGTSDVGDAATPGPMVYGKVRNDRNLLSTMKHLQEIAGAVGELENLEREIQRQFVTLAARGI